MAQTRIAAQGSLLPARVGVIAPAELGATTIAALRARGITGRIVDEPHEDDEVLAWALAAPPAGAAAVELAARCARAAEAGRPICLLTPGVRGSNRAAIERAAAMSYLRAHGAAVCHDIDAWLEAIVMLVRFGLPAGPRAAVIAPVGSWLEAQATAIVIEAEATGARSPLTAPDDPTDVVLYDPALGVPPRTTPGMHVAVAPRGELAGDTPALYTARAALAAIATLGRAAERIAVGLGPASASASAELSINRELLERQLADLDKLRLPRIGDHGVKALLKAYNVDIPRQAVARTPSEAVKKARLVGYPVEIKPWGHDLPSEPEGCPIEKDVSSDALVRQAFTAVLAKAKKHTTSDTVIIRETPTPGREVSVTFLQLGSLGWTVVLEAGSRIAAAPAPLRLIDAQALAAHVVASRAGDPDPDRAGLANILRRASHLVVDVPSIATLELPRVIVGGRGARTLVVDAFATLR
jgi:hypothetical protein